MNEQITKPDNKSNLNDHSIEWVKVLLTSFLAATISVFLWTILYIIEPVLMFFLIIIIPISLILTSIMGFIVINKIIIFSKQKSGFLFLVFNLIFTIIYWFIFTSPHSIIIKLADRIRF